MGRHRHAVNVRLDGLAVVLGPLLSDARVVAAALVDVDSGMVLDAWSAVPAVEGGTDLDMLGAQHAEVMRSALALLRESPESTAGAEVVLGLDGGVRHLLRTVPDPHGDRLALAVVVDGPQRVVDRVRKRLRAVAVDALTAGPTVSRRPVFGMWSFAMAAPDGATAAESRTPPVRTTGVPEPAPGRNAEPVPGWDAEPAPGRDPVPAGTPPPWEPALGRAPEPAGTAASPTPREPAPAPARPRAGARSPGGPVVRGGVVRGGPVPLDAVVRGALVVCGPVVGRRPVLLSTPVRGALVIGGAVVRGGPVPLDAVVRGALVVCGPVVGRRPVLLSTPVRGALVIGGAVVRSLVVRTAVLRPARRRGPAPLAPGGPARAGSARAGTAARPLTRTGCAGRTVRAGN